MYVLSVFLSFVGSGDLYAAVCDLPDDIFVKTPDIFLCIYLWGVFLKLGQSVCRLAGGSVEQMYSLNASRVRA